MDYSKVLEEQIELLSNWNKGHADVEPEQVRKNTETIALCIEALNAELSRQLIATAKIRN